MSLPWESLRTTCLGQSTVRLPHQSEDWFAMTREGAAALLALRAAYDGCALHSAAALDCRGNLCVLPASVSLPQDCHTRKEDWFAMTGDCQAQRDWGVSARSDYTTFSWNDAA